MPKNLVDLSVSAPGFYGLNKQSSGELLPPNWATEAMNCVIDSSGRIAARKGYKNTHTTAISGSPDVRSIHEYIDGSGNTLIILAAGNAIYKVDGTSLTDISGTITTPTADNWHFVNFNGNCIGFQYNHAPIVITSVAGSFANITLSGTQQPTTNADNVTAAFGRLWTIDGTDLKYSDALIYGAWNGVFDLSTVWLSGMDKGVVVTEFNGHLVIFGERSIVVYNNPWDPSGSGTLDTTQMSLVENISGIGCISRDTVQHVGNDVVFLSSTGLRSLGRTIQEKSMPLRDLSKNNKDYLITALASLSLNNDAKGSYNQREGLYLLSIPNTVASTGIVLCFDMRSFLQDGSARVTEWDTYFPAMCTSINSVTYVGTAGWVSTYTGYRDNALSDGTGGSSFRMTYEGPWSDMSKEGRDVSSMLKIPKKIGLILYGLSDVTVSVKWAYDFNDSFSSRNITIPTSGSLAEFGIAEFGIAEFGGGAGYHKVNSSMSRTGRVIKFGLNVDVSGLEIALQQINIQAKIGKMVV